MRYSRDYVIMDTDCYINVSLNAWLKILLCWACALCFVSVAHFRCLQQCLDGGSVASDHCLVIDREICHDERWSDACAKSLRILRKISKVISLILSKINAILCSWNPSVVLVSWRQFRRKIGRYVSQTLLCMRTTLYSSSWTEGVWPLIIALTFTETHLRRKSWVIMDRNWTVNNRHILW